MINRVHILRCLSHIMAGSRLLIYHESIAQAKETNTYG
jgi:hypothetical protein